MSSYTNFETLNNTQQKGDMQENVDGQKLPNQIYITERRQSLWLLDFVLVFGVSLLLTS